MRITFTQSGGFVGAVRGCRIDAATLPVDERRQLEALVAGSGLDASFERLSDTGRDRRQDEIRIDRGGAAVRVCCDDACLPEPARPLERFLAERATPRRLGWEADGAEPEGQRAVVADAAAWGRFEGQVVARWHDDGREMTLVERVVRDDTPPPPSAEAEAIVQWFATHDVAAETIPTLPVPPGG